MGRPGQVTGEEYTKVGGGIDNSNKTFISSHSKASNWWRTLSEKHNTLSFRGVQFQTILSDPVTNKINIPLKRL